MTKLIALIDANNFYAACEQAFDPSLTGRPLVILSNNDGCIVARNAEARALGFSMGKPYFKVQYELEKLGVAVRSSNYALYGDMSRRLMSLLNVNCEELEIYSIDEAFARLKHPLNCDLKPWARRLRALINRDLGLPIAIGLGANKVQAKLANHLAKTIDSNAGIFDLTCTRNQEAWLETIAVEDVWGVGHKLARWLHIKGVKTALQLREMPNSELRAKCGVTGIRLQRELRGETCSPLNLRLIQKKETCVSRTFSRPITSLEELQQALSSYVVRASEKLRSQEQRAGAITVFTSSSPFSPPSYTKAASIQLDTPSNDTTVLLKASLPLAKRIFRPHVLLIKAGAIMQQLQSTDHLQQHLFSTCNMEEQQRHEKLLGTIDLLNKHYGHRTIHWAACGIEQSWNMRRSQLSRASTTRIKEVPLVTAYN